jgi:hypothetical protein
MCADLFILKHVCESILAAIFQLLITVLFNHVFALGVLVATVRRRASKNHYIVLYLTVHQEKRTVLFTGCSFAIYFPFKATEK